MSDRLLRAEIDLNQYKHNLQTIQTQIGSRCQIMAVIKANAYGHGLTVIAKTAQKSGIVSYLGVACLGEARELRNTGLKLPILILNYLDPESLVQAIELKCAITVMDEEVLGVLEQLAKDKKVVVHLKIDTGMHRGGANPDLALNLAKRIKQNQNIQFEGVFSHFATADDDLDFAKQQLATFNKFITLLKQEKIDVPLIHMDNSAAVFTLPQSHFSMVRVGALSYGINPCSSVCPTIPILQLKSEVVRIIKLKKGDCVGYGCDFIAKEKKTVALIPGGYGDGLSRSPAWPYVLIRGSKCPVVGRISMDQLTVDVSHLREIKMHDKVVLLGKQEDVEIRAEDIAQSMGTIGYDIVTSLAERVERKYYGKN